MQKIKLNAKQMPHINDKLMFGTEWKSKIRHSEGDLICMH